MRYRILTPATAITFAAIFLFIFTFPANAQVTLKLLGQLDPFSGERRYADVWGEGNYAYLGSYSGNGVMIIDISDAASPRLVGHYNPTDGGRFQDVIVTGGIGYFSSENRGGLHIVDVRNPASPVLLSQITEAKNGFPNVHELFVADGVLYEADSRTNRIKVFDVTKPENPTFVREIVTTDNRFIHAITVINGRLFTSGWGGKTDIYDVRKILTEEPRLLGSVDSGSSSHAAWMSADGKIMASARETTNGDVRLFDISDPANPVQLASITAQSFGREAFSAHNPYILGNMLFVSWYQAGLLVFDITNPRQPKLTGVFDTHTGSINGFDGCWGVYPFLGFDRVLISDLNNGLYIVDASTALAGPQTVSAASYGISAVAGKSIVTAFGSNMAPQVAGATSLPLPTTLAGTNITVQDVNGADRLAPLFYVSPTQINYQIPSGTVQGPAMVKIATTNGQSSIGTTIVQAAAPSIFTVDLSGGGTAVAIDAFSSTVGPFHATRPNGQPNIIVVFGTGLGNDATDIEANVSANVQATIDGQVVTISYAGGVPGLVGLNQFNIVFPVGISSGFHKLVISRNGISSNSVSINVI